MTIVIVATDGMIRCAEGGNYNSCDLLKLHRQDEERKIITSTALPREICQQCPFKYQPWWVIDHPPPHKVWQLLQDTVGIISSATSYRQK